MHFFFAFLCSKSLMFILVIVNRMEMTVHIGVLFRVTHFYSNVPHFSRFLFFLADFPHFCAN